MAYPTNTSQISFATINVEMGFASNAQLSLAYAGNQELGIVIGNQVKICEFYSNGCAGVIPPTPTGFTEVLQSGLIFNLAWNASVGATSYKIYRGGVYNKTVTGTSTTGSATGYGVNTCWSVSAVNASGESSQTAQICGYSGSPSFASFDTTFSGYAYLYDACGVFTDTTRYTSGDGIQPQLNDIVYTDSGGTNRFNGLSLWYNFNDGYTIRIDNLGNIIDFDFCI